MPSPPDWPGLPGASFQYQKGRSHSLTYDRDNTASEAANISPASSSTALDEKEIDEAIRNLPEGSGMRGIAIHDFFRAAFLLLLDLWPLIRNSRMAQVPEVAQVHQDLVGLEIRGVVKSL